MKNKFNIKHLSELNGREDLYDTLSGNTASGFGYMQFGTNIDGKHQHYIIIFDSDLNVTYQEVGDSLFIDSCNYTDIFTITRYIGDKAHEGVIDAYGNVIIPCIYESIDLDTKGNDVPDKDTPIWVKTFDKKEILFDRKGNQLSEPHDKIDSCDYNGLFAFKDKDCSGLLDLKGKVVLKTDYSYCGIVLEHDDINRYLIVSREKFAKCGILDIKGNIIINPDTNDFYEIKYLGKSRFYAKSDTKGIQIIDLKNEGYNAD